ncbi:MAG: hypothetical protein Q4A93_07425 [Actinomycetota bacterium]|nr:hypothetical protein [Actinomycetota bacterium]
MAKRGFDDILFDIVSGMNFDPKHDREYLEEAMLQYRDHPLAFQIIDACRRLRLATGPDEAQEEAARSLAERRGEVMDDLAMAWGHIEDGELEEAFSIAEPLVLHYDDLSSSGRYQDDEEHMFLDFNSMAEEFIYRLVNKDERREIRLNAEPFAEAYHVYGVCLLESDRPEEAVPVLAKAVRWNPADPDLWFTWADVHESLGDEEMFDRCTEDAYPYIWMMEDLARYHWNKARFHLASEGHELAAAHATIALDFARAEEAKEELSQLKGRCEGHEDMDGDRAIEVLQQADAHILPSAEAVGAIYEIVHIALENDEKEAALPLAMNLYSLTGDEEMKKVIDDILDELDEGSGDDDDEDGE